MATTDYSGRLVDLLIFQGIQPAGDQRVLLALSDEDGDSYVITGIAKLSQSFAVLFLTELGSIPYNPELGTEFVTAIRQGRIADETDVTAEFRVAVELIRRTLDLEADNNDLPYDEQLESVELENFTLDTARSLLQLYVSITSVAGESRQLFLPIPLAIQ